MEKFRITDIGTLEIRLINDRIQFSTTPDYQEVRAELSKENALKIADKLRAWANGETSENSLHKHGVNNCGCYNFNDLNPKLQKTLIDIENKIKR